MTVSFRPPLLLYSVQRLYNKPISPLTSAFRVTFTTSQTAKDNIRWCKKINLNNINFRNMAARGHRARRGSSTARTHGRGKSSLSLNAHYIDRSDVKAPYIDTHCHLFTTLQMMQEVVLLPFGLPYRISANQILQRLFDSSIPKNRVDLLVKKLFPPNVKAVVDIHCDLPMDDYHKLKQVSASAEWPEDFAY